MKVLTSGYASIDRIFKLTNAPTIGQSSLILNENNWELYFGGCAPNIAYNLAKLGIHAAPVMRVGYDFESTGYQQYLHQGGVNLQHVTIVNNDITPFCFLFEDPSHEHTTIFYPGAQHPKYFKPLSDSIFNDVIYGVMTVGDPQDNIHFLEQCKKHGIATLFGMRGDQNAFPLLLLTEALNYSEVLFMNHLECEILKERLGLDSINDLYTTGKAQTIVITQGKKGCRFSTRSQKKFVDVPTVESPVIDTTGSGDAFMSGFIYGLLNNYTPLACAQLGVVLSSFTIQKRGCTTNAPNQTQLLNVFQQRFL